jgi:hypothetical protein
MQCDALWPKRVTSARSASLLNLLLVASAVRNCEVAERTVVWMVGWTMSIDEDFVALMDRTMVSLDRTEVNGFILRICAGIWAAVTRRGRGCWTGGSGTRWRRSRSNADSFGWDSRACCCSGLFSTSRELRRLVLVVVGRAIREWWLVGDRFAIIEGFIGLKILDICRSECEDR